MARTKKAKEPTKEQIERKELMDYFASISTTQVNYPLTYKQLKTMMEENPSMTYKGIKYALWYAINHQEMEINSIGIVPYIYEDAKNYYIWLQNIKKQLSSWERNEKEIVVTKSINREENIFE